MPAVECGKQQRKHNINIFEFNVDYNNYRYDFVILQLIFISWLNIL